MIYPLLMKPVFKEYLWGGEKLKKVYKKDCNFDKIAESWEFSCREDGKSLIANGIYAGMTLKDYVKKFGKSVLGENAKDDDFPFLIKLIDTSDRLSVQVHPDDETAIKSGEKGGKTELWYIMDCEKGAKLYYGTNKELSQNEIINFAKDGRITDYLNEFSVKKGDVFLIKPGMIHAIGKNMTVAEIGTNCNITYRLYDYKRKDKNGCERPLHLAQAAAAARTNMEKICGFDANGELLCGKFAVKYVKIHRETKFNAQKDSCHCIMLTFGKGSIKCGGENLEVKAGDSVFIPAGAGEYSVCGDCEILSTRVI